MKKRLFAAFLLIVSITISAMDEFKVIQQQVENIEETSKIIKTFFDESKKNNPDERIELSKGAYFQGGQYAIYSILPNENIRKIKFLLKNETIDVKLNELCSEKLILPKKEIVKFKNLQNLLKKLQKIPGDSTKDHKKTINTVLKIKAKPLEKSKNIFSFIKTL